MAPDPTPTPTPTPTPAAPGARARRPVILIPARFSDSASALRYRAEVAARALVEAVYEAGGEPLLMHPHAPAGVADVEAVRSRLAVADGVLLPGGGDLDASWAGQESDPSEYDVDLEQDAFDLAVARVVLDSDVPLLAVCRGLQVVNVVLGGDLRQDMGEGHHRHRVHAVEAVAGSRVAELTGPQVAEGGREVEVTGPRVVRDAGFSVSCYHHQCLGRLGDGLVVTARAADGVVEAVELPGRAAFFLGVQWHPEDTASSDPVQAGVFRAFVGAAAGAAAAVGAGAAVSSISSVSSASSASPVSSVC